jgi:hypothetical protein
MQPAYVPRCKPSVLCAPLHQHLWLALPALLSDATQGMLSGSLRALDGAVLQHVLGKLNEEERQREWRPPGA